MTRDATEMERSATEPCSAEMAAFFSASMAAVSYTHLDVYKRQHLDASLLGGILMSVGGKRIDASVVSQLENARTVLKQSMDGGEC